MNERWKEVPNETPLEVLTPWMDSAIRAIVRDEIARNGSPAPANDEVQRLRHEVHCLENALAERILADWNAKNAAAGEPNNWPAQQEWTDLAGSSRAILRRRARIEAGLEHEPEADPNPS
jgi:hypothetical protein